ncbi:hypothetical protein [Streptomyces sp. MS191]|uniref:hypothetical protein n=1 Tax=Streptomyces sp. ms191 TaxID=1827978 RepID=UPI0011CE1A38|nr:hypothetical protein [Streptomyces sp. ms191]
MATPDSTQFSLYKLLDRHLMERLMKRTGTGAAVTIRGLADLVGVPHGTIGNLLTGEQESVIEPTANAICGVIGVDLLILFAPHGRSTRHTGRPRIEVAA